MKSRMMCVLLVLLLSASMTACSSNATPETKPGTASETPSDTNPVADAYKAVLLNNAEFFSVDNKKKLSLDDFLTNKALYDVIFTVTNFTVLDMDGDKVPEVVLELAVDNNPQFYEVLHYADGTVYGYNIVYRGLIELKADGTFSYSSGAADNGYGKLKFQSDAYKTDILGYMASSQDDGGITISYFIDNKPVTKESYDSFMKAQNGKTDVVWHEFTQQNVEAELAENP